MKYAKNKIAETEYDALISAVLNEKSPEAPPELLRGVRAGIGIIVAERAKFAPPAWLTRRFYRYAPILVCVAIVGFFGVTASMRGFTLDLGTTEPYNFVFEQTETETVRNYSPEAVVYYANYEKRLNSALDDTQETAAETAPTKTVRNAGSGYASAQYIVTGPQPAFMRGLTATALSDGTFYYARVPAKLIDNDAYSANETVSVLWVPNT